MAVCIAATCFLFSAALVHAQTIEQRVTNLENRLTRIYIQQAQQSDQQAALKSTTDSIVALNLDHRLTAIEVDVAFIKWGLLGIGAAILGQLVKMFFDVVQRAPVVDRRRRPEED